MHLRAVHTGLRARRTHAWARGGALTPRTQRTPPVLRVSSSGPSRERGGAEGAACARRASCLCCEWRKLSLPLLEGKKKGPFSEGDGEQLEPTATYIRTGSTARTPGHRRQARALQLRRGRGCSKTMPLSKDIDTARRSIGRHQHTQHSAAHTCTHAGQAHTQRTHTGS